MHVELVDVLLIVIKERISKHHVSFELYSSENSEIILKLYSLSNPHLRTSRLLLTVRAVIKSGRL